MLSLIYVKFVFFVLHFMLCFSSSHILCYATSVILPPSLLLCSAGHLLHTLFFLHRFSSVLQDIYFTFSQGDFSHSFEDKAEILENLWTGKREGDAGLTELLNDTTKRKLTTQSKASTKKYFAASPFSIYDDTKWPESNVLWGSLSLNFVKYGKEILSQRDAALYTALDALQEACALERLIRCLSAYSELQASKKHDPQLVVDKFLNFHQDLSSAASAAQSLARPNLTVPASTMEAAKEASERRTFAASWIKAALESELSRAPLKATAMEDHLDASRKLQSSLYRQRKCAADTVSSRGSCSLTVADRAKALQSECNRWFLRYVERFLDLVHGDGSYTSNESRIATLLYQLKRVNDWLVAVPGNDHRSREGIAMEDDEAEACGRVRRKIYDIFLRHVESAAMALDSVIVADNIGPQSPANT
ncbi:hypothetical protein KSP39_PZI015260 [Platanthera zijinensis]|uniref:DUF6857 domain-containing protein n=1 Tax=Platanthera zijinensis TaxID=2320716 RepID=A0AAP0B982_9ASPA